MGGCVLLRRCVFVVPPERNDMAIDGQILSVGSGDMVCKVPRRGAMYRARGEQARNMGRPHARKHVGARFSTEGGANTYVATVGAVVVVAFVERVRPDDDGAYVWAAISLRLLDPLRARQPGRRGVDDRTVVLGHRAWLRL